MRPTFEDWLKQVDITIYQKTGMTHEDLPDCCYSDWYEERVSATQAANRAIRNAKE